MDHFSQLCLLEGKSHVDLRNLTSGLRCRQTWLENPLEMDFFLGKSKHRLYTMKKMKNMKVNWDDYSHILWKNKSHVPNHQPAIGKR